MREEIFGPLLPVVAYDSLDDAIGYVNRRERPLALYWFGDNAARRDRVLHGRSPAASPSTAASRISRRRHQPFGGVGASGIGAYHGVYGFRAFSKEKPVYYQGRLGMHAAAAAARTAGCSTAVLAWFAGTHAVTRRVVPEECARRAGGPGRPAGMRTRERAR